MRQSHESASHGCSSHEQHRYRGRCECLINHATEPGFAPAEPVTSPVSSISAFVQALAPISGVRSAPYLGWTTTHK